MSSVLNSLLFITLLLQAPAAGIRITGRVVDGETGRPLATATVTLSPRTDSFRLNLGPNGTGATANESKRTVNVSANGTFQFVNIPRGAYRLHAEHSKPAVPYRSESLDIDIADRNIEDVGMILSPAVPKVAVPGRLVPAGGGALPAAIQGFTLSGEQVAVQRDGTFEVRMRPLEKYEFVLPESYYIQSVSAGQWDPASGLWTIRDKPSSPVQITLGVGRQRISGRILTANRVPAAQATVTLIGPLPGRNPQTVTLGPGAAFSLVGLRPGDYELRAQIGAGDGTQAGLLKLTVDTQTREGLELVLKGLTAMTGQVLVSGRTLEDLLRFKPYIELEDALGPRRLAIDSKGTFQFRSFEDAFAVAIRDLPIELRLQSITLGPSTVTIRVGTLPGDGPDFFRFQVPEIR